MDIRLIYEKNRMAGPFKEFGRFHHLTQNEFPTFIRLWNDADESKYKVS